MPNEIPSRRSVVQAKRSPQWPIAAVRKWRFMAVKRASAETFSASYCSMRRKWHLRRLISPPRFSALSRRCWPTLRRSVSVKSFFRSKLASTCEWREEDQQLCRTYHAVSTSKTSSPREEAMKRSELYERVWSVPMYKLAKEYGISGVGLAKLCRRHSVPVPPRGHWAKLQAGKRSPRLPLPAPELDVHVNLRALDQKELARQADIQKRQAKVLQMQAAHAQTREPIEFAADLEGTHALVRATRRYCDRIPRLLEKAKRLDYRGMRADDPKDRPPPEQHGRFHLLRRGCLDINASIESMDWILRFHTTIFRELTDGGMVIARREQTEDRSSRTARDPAIEATFNGETLTLSFSEGYRRIRLSATELEKTRREHSWASEFETRPSGNFTFNVRGTEYQGSKAWQGTQEKLQGKVHEIVRTAFDLARLLPELRKEREAREAKARHDAEMQRLELQRRTARSEQLKQAFLMMEADARVQQLRDFLGRIEKRVPEFLSPFDERLRVWLEVVRGELDANCPVDRLLRQSLTPPSWASWPPAWWPAESSGETPASDGGETT